MTLNKTLVISLKKHKDLAKQYNLILKFKVHGKMLKKEPISNGLDKSQRHQQLAQDHQV